MPLAYSFSANAHLAGYSRNADGIAGIEKFVIDSFVASARAGAVCPPSVFVWLLTLLYRESGAFTRES